MLKTELRAKFLGFTDKGKAVLAQGEKLDMLRCYNEAGKKLRGCQYKVVSLTCKTIDGELWIVDADPLEDPGEDQEEADNEE